jgi:phosphonate transport system substrate-binding protein
MELLQVRRTVPIVPQKAARDAAQQGWTSMTNLDRAGALAALALALAAQPAAAQDCPHGQLDPMYCDADGDLVADAPTDPAELQDPGTLVFAYTPVEDPAIYADIWEPFIAHMEEVTGKDVQFFAVQSNSAQVEAMRSGRLHVAGFSTGPTPYAVNLAGAVPFAIMGAEDGRFGYTLQVYTQADSDIQAMADLAGKRIAHTSPTSNSGNLAPRALFPALGVTPDEDYEVTYSGSHDQSMLGVVAGDYDAAPVASEVVERMAERDLYDPADVRIVWESDRFPTTSYAYAHDLTPELKAAIEEAFFSFDFSGTALGEEFTGVSKFVPITYEDDWKVIREIQATNGVQYTPEGLAAE